MAGFGISTVKLRILQVVPGFKVSTAVFYNIMELKLNFSSVCCSKICLIVLLVV